ncbi:MAG: IcmT/TraK family protein [Alphaproteobacteria bacterium]|nr:IcmT/TraK family protein [Alphaproteobacteria bacterium]
MAKELDNLQEKVNWHWRNSMRPVRFLAFDARAALPLPLLLVYARLSTIILTIVFLLAFRHLERKGLTFPAAMRALRANFVGRERPAWIRAQQKKFTDWA